MKDNPQMKPQVRRPVSLDYDSNPDRFRVGSESSRKFGQGDVHESVAYRIAAEGLHPVLDLGCGEGRLVSLLLEQDIPVVGFDYSQTMLSSVKGWRVRGDAAQLPFRSEVFRAVAALYMLYHLSVPETALSECRRVLCHGGLFVAAAPSRFSDPELSLVFPHIEHSTFDAELAPILVGQFFDGVEVENWDAPLIHLPHLEAVEMYLFGRGLEREKCEDAAKALGAPLSVTKRGCLVWGYKAR